MIQMNHDFSISEIEKVKCNNIIKNDVCEEKIFSDNIDLNQDTNQLNETSGSILNDKISEYSNIFEENKCLEIENDMLEETKSLVKNIKENIEMVHNINSTKEVTMSDKLSEVTTTITMIGINLETNNTLPIQKLSGACSENNLILSASDNEIDKVDENLIFPELKEVTSLNTFMGDVHLNQDLQMSIKDSSEGVSKNHEIENSNKTTCMEFKGITESCNSEDIMSGDCVQNKNNGIFETPENSTMSIFNDQHPNYEASDNDDHYYSDVFNNSQEIIKSDNSNGDILKESTCLLKIVKEKEIPLNSNNTEDGPEYDRFLEMTFNSTLNKIDISMSNQKLFEENSENISMVVFQNKFDKVDDNSKSLELNLETHLNTMNSNVQVMETPDSSVNCLQTGTIEDINNTDWIKQLLSEIVSSLDDEATETGGRDQTFFKSASPCQWIPDNEYEEVCKCYENHACLMVVNFDENEVTSKTDHISENQIEPAICLL